MEIHREMKEIHFLWRVSKTRYNGLITYSLRNILNNQQLTFVQSDWIFTTNQLELNSIENSGGRYDFCELTARWANNEFYFSIILFSNFQKFRPGWFCKSPYQISVV